MPPGAARRAVHASPVPGIRFLRHGIRAAIDPTVR
jgi:hypothetical protein